MIAPGPVIIVLNIVRFLHSVLHDPGAGLGLLPTPYGFTDINVRIIYIRQFELVHTDVTVAHCFTIDEFDLRRLIMTRRWL